MENKLGQIKSSNINFRTSEDFREKVKFLTNATGETTTGLFERLVLQEIEKIKIKNMSTEQQTIADAKAKLQDAIELLDEIMKKDPA